jgi:hypothetical protein
MTMRRRSRTSAKFGATGLVVGVGIVTWVAVAWSMRLHPEPAAAEPELSAADVVALRFPYELEKADLPTTPATNDTATSEADETLALFDPNPTYPTITPSDAQEAPPPTPPQAADPDARPAPITTGTSELTAAAHRNSARPGAVLSDGQIAGIKRRLRLTPQQQQMWPAVEVALRSLSYPKKSDGARKGSAIDTNSPEVQQLTSAAYPLVMSFSDDQKRELHEIAHVAGLEQLVPKF